jgi:hypothetical protein
VTRPAPAAWRAVPVAALAVLALAACSSSSGTASASGSTAAGSSAPRSGARAGGFGGLSGPIASVGSGSFTLTAATGTATVDWTGTTAFEKTAAATLAGVTPGSCVAVTETAGSDASTGSVDATAVRISAPVNGSCGFGAFGGGGAGLPGGVRPSGGAGAPPSGAAGRSRGAGGLGGRALVGTVDSVSGNSFVVDVTTRGTDGSSSSTTTTTVDVSGTTTYTATTTAGAADLAVGECARVADGSRPTAAGGTAARSAAPATATGPVTARSVTLSQPVGGSCPTPAAGRRSGTGSAAGGSGAHA